jgi:hypothetical protein
MTDAEGAKTYFILANGRVEVGDASAVFTPGGGGQSVRVSADQGFPIVHSQSTTTVTFPTVAAFAGATVMSGEAIAYAIGMSINLLLSVFLIIIGITMLMQHRRARRQHLIYAWLKIPVAIVASIAYGMMMSQMMTAAAGAPVGFGAMVTGMAAGVAAFYLVIGCAYPIALLIVMNTKSVKEYYKSRTVT